MCGTLIFFLHFIQVYPLRSFLYHQKHMSQNLQKESRLTLLILNLIEAFHPSGLVLQQQNFALVTKDIVHRRKYFWWCNYQVFYHIVHLLKLSGNLQSEARLTEVRRHHPRSRVYCILSDYTALYPRTFTMQKLQCYWDSNHH